MAHDGAGRQNSAKTMPQKPHFPHAPQRRLVGFQQRIAVSPNPFLSPGSGHCHGRLHAPSSASIRQGRRWPEIRRRRVAGASAQPEKDGVEGVIVNDISHLVDRVSSGVVSAHPNMQSFTGWWPGWPNPPQSVVSAGGTVTPYERCEASEHAYVPVKGGGAFLGIVCTKCGNARAVSFKS